MLNKVAERLGGLFSLLWREIMKFGAVGGVAYVIDSTLFLFLREGALSHKTLTAGVIASVVATVFSWVANRYWTFRHRRRPGVLRELMMFAIMNAIGIGIATFCLFISHYVLGYQTTHADFIAKNVIGLVLGTIFRFIAYRYWVFSVELAEDPAFADPPRVPRLPGGRQSTTPGDQQSTPGKGAVKGQDRHRTGA
ncbi:GtrA family protein [Arthrobacter monumenti]